MSRYAYVPLASPERVYGRIPVEWGFDPVPVVAARPMRRPVRIGRPLVESVVMPSRLDLPVREGQVVGEVRVYDRKRLLGRTPPSPPRRATTRASSTAPAGTPAGRSTT